MTRITSFLWLHLRRYAGCCCYAKSHPPPCPSPIFTILNWDVMAVGGGWVNREQLYLWPSSLLALDPRET